jgi:hypothetical protein
MRSVLGVGCLALALTICVRASLAAPAPQASCAPPSATTLRTVGEVIVYRTVPLGRAHIRSVRACRAGVGDMLLARNGYYEGFGGRRAVAARGNEVAWVTVTRDDGLDGDVAVLDVVARDLGAHESQRLSARSNGSRYLMNDAGIPLSAGGVPSIVITAHRNVAWIACDSFSRRDVNEHYDRCGVGPRSVWLATDGTSTARPNNPPTELARGHTIEARSLRVDASGGVLTWRQNGRLHRVEV